ncbi:hypothetical protein Q055_02597, partial [Pseudomonas aeruginosa BL01]
MLFSFVGKNIDITFTSPTQPTQVPHCP